jgi:Fe-S-cluster containining protein
MINKKTFRCKRCSECCKKYTIMLFKDDVKKIKNKCYDESYFLDKETIGAYKNKFILKKINGKCVFLKKKDNVYFCGIYDIRPKICKQYPFFKKHVKSCKPITFS